MGWEEPALLIFMAHTLPAQATKTPFYVNFSEASESQNAKKNKNINDLPMYNPYKWHSSGRKISSLSLMSVRFSFLAGYTDFTTQPDGFVFCLSGIFEFSAGGMERDICKRVKRLISIDNMCLRYIFVFCYFCVFYSVCFCVNICMLIWIYVASLIGSHPTNGFEFL